MKRGRGRPPGKRNKATLIAQAKLAAQQQAKLKPAVEMKLAPARGRPPAHGSTQRVNVPLLSVKHSRRTTRGTDNNLSVSSPGPAAPPSAHPACHRPAQHAPHSRAVPPVSPLPAFPSQTHGPQTGPGRVYVQHLFLLLFFHRCGYPASVVRPALLRSAPTFRYQF